MGNKKSYLQDTNNLWPEIFDEIDMNVVPLNYIHIIEIQFKNNKIWEINLKKNFKNMSWEKVEEEFKLLIIQYEKDIEKINFQLDTFKVKRDITRITKKFLKSRNLK